MGHSVPGEVHCGPVACGAVLSLPRTSCGWTSPLWVPFEVSGSHVVWRRVWGHMPESEALAHPGLFQAEPQAPLTLSHRRLKRSWVPTLKVPFSMGVRTPTTRPERGPWLLVQWKILSLSPHGWLNPPFFSVMGSLLRCLVPLAAVSRAIPSSCGAQPLHCGGLSHRGALCAGLQQLWRSGP